MSSLRPVSTKSSSSKVNMVSDTHWDGESVLTSKVSVVLCVCVVYVCVYVCVYVVISFPSQQNGDDDDGEIHHIGRHEVLIQPPKYVHS